jgi:hypothetical protein
VLLDKAASLHYLRVQHRDGQWISCECCFTIVHDVLVACISIYRRDAKSERTPHPPPPLSSEEGCANKATGRAIDAPQIRRIFSSSPRDPRYHMLEHLSPKFKMPPVEREPRAALILNRFTRPLSIMFATESVAHILGLRREQLETKSFYQCIAENCLADAVRCLESAKSNDSIAYLRFWFRDPRTQDELDNDEGAEEEGLDELDGRHSPSSSDSDGGAQLHSPMDADDDSFIKTEPVSPGPSKAEIHQAISSESSSFGTTSASAGPSGAVQIPRRSPSIAPDNRDQRRANVRRRERIPSFELEAVVSCTSDGLVVVLRKARPPIPTIRPPTLPLELQNGLFAAPWGEQPVNPYYPPELYHRFRAPFLPEHMPLQEHAVAAGGPPIDQLMRSIRDVAVFAWALVGINGQLASYSRGTPRGEAQPPDGLPIWDPNAGPTSYMGPENQARRRWASLGVGHYDQKATLSSSATFISQGFVSTMTGPNAPDQYYAQQSAWISSAAYTHASVPLQGAAHQTHHRPEMSPRYQGHHPMQEGWGEGAPHQYGDQLVPTTQASQSDERPYGYHYTWP